MMATVRRVVKFVCQLPQNDFTGDAHQILGFAWSQGRRIRLGI
jgi:hypothetical protein